MNNLWLFCMILFLIAALYAAVGHGGASGYLALMALFGVSAIVMRPTALILNLFVSATSFIQYYRGKHFRLQIFWPLALASVPMAFIGGQMVLNAHIYNKILGVLLLFPVFRFFFLPNVKEEDKKPANIIFSLIVGGIIGLFSGMIGIGGGIILSPVLLLLKWTNQKETAAISALFIFVNSISGLIGQLSKGVQFSNEMFLYIAVAFAGGLCGAYMGSIRLNQNILKYTLAIVLLMASYKLMFS